jgi:diacylglycerol kinase family enzyme
VRVTLIINPAASSVTTRARVVIESALTSSFQLTTVETERRGHAEHLARVAVDQGADVIVSLGGDGTLNETANGLAGTTTALAPLPGGSTNVFARTIGVSNDLLDAVGQLLASLKRGSYRRVGLGAVNGRHFVFHAGIGFDAAVVARVEAKSKFWKRFGAGHPLYVASALSTWFRHYDRVHPKMTVRLDSGEQLAGCYWAIVHKTSPYTFLGPRALVLAPEAGLDSALSLTAFRTLRFTPILSGAASAMRSGRLLRRHPGILGRSGLDALTIECTAPIPYQVDGDHIGEADCFEVTYEEDLLTLVVP